jgi:hypothetical protein
MSDRKKPVIVTGLREVIAGRPDGSHPWRLFGTFEHVHGPAAVQDGREGRIVLEYGELARLLGAIPASQFDGSPVALASLKVLLEWLQSAPS